MPLKLLVIHSTSMVGKSTTVATLLHPRLESPRVFSVEEQNQDAARYGIDVTRYHASEFKRLMEDVELETNDLIVDVGASQYAEVMNAFDHGRGVINDFDVVIVPTTPNGRVQEETLTTIESLRQVNLQMDKLRIIFNRAAVLKGRNLERQFEDVIAHLFSEKQIPYYKDLVLFESPIHADLREAGLSFRQIENDHTNYRQALDEAKKLDPRGSEILRLVRMLALQRAVARAKEDLDHAFAALRLPADNTKAKE
ncbi:MULTISPECIES: hypothetical protein [Pandoraea]|uniref:Plasmid stability protein StbB n=2 Tax=Pandoraea TaxID=93217 RepID=A0A5E4XK71_9BURK|nr:MULTISPECIES: hypothetical protein [Pandoraea]VVE18701.1 plasmid stability protein StbB [Pandoraea cepalis]VVE36565.1 plasmid stability protein StbB [Pandoraea terrigena]